MAVSLADISKLRSMTGAGMMDCKKALTEANGNFDEAIKLIRERGQAIAAKRSDRDASEGCVLAGVDGKYAAIVALRCETDFVAKNEDFVALTQTILNAALKDQPASLSELLKLSVDGRSISELISDRSGVTGEKMELGFFETVTGESTIFYIHPGNKLASIVAFAESTVDHQVARDVAMQVAAMNPISLDRNNVPADVVEKELEIGREKARQEGKPENILDKIAQGRLNKFYQEFTLLEQSFIKDSKESVGQYLKNNNATAIAFKRVTLNQD